MLNIIDRAVKLYCHISSQYHVLFCVGSPPNSTEGSNRRLTVYRHCIPLCESGDLQTDVAADIIGLLMLEVKKKEEEEEEKVFLKYLYKYIDPD